MEGLSVEIIEPRLFAGTVSEELARAMSEAIDDRGHCFVVLAGGSTPAAVYRALGTPPRVGEIDWSKVTFLMGDERWVGHEDTLSNLKMVNTQLISHLKGELPRVIPVDTSLGSPEEGAERYAADIRAAMGCGTQEMPQFDLVLLGIGNDGHIASLFPGQEALNEQRALTVTAIQPEDGTQRVSLTMPALVAARRVYLLVSGAGKAQIMHQVIDQRKDGLPAVEFLKQRKPLTTCFLDSAAATELDMVRKRG